LVGPVNRTLPNAGQRAALFGAAAPADAALQLAGVARADLARDDTRLVLLPDLLGQQGEIEVGLLVVMRQEVQGHAAAIVGELGLDGLDRDALLGDEPARRDQRLAFPAAIPLARDQVARRGASHHVLQAVALFAGAQRPEHDDLADVVSFLGFDDDVVAQLELPDQRAAVIRIYLRRAALKAHADDVTVHMRSKFEYVMLDL